LKQDDASLLNYASIIQADGRIGYSQEGPFDAIHVGAAADTLPQALIDQLKIGGKLILPLVLGAGNQALYLIEKLSETETNTQEICGVMYVPLTSQQAQLSSYE